MSVKYQVIPDGDRERQNVHQALLAELVAGRTVFAIKPSQGDLSAYYSNLKARGFLLRRRLETRDGEEGYVMWAVPERERLTRGFGASNTPGT